MKRFLSGLMVALTLTLALGVGGNAPAHAFATPHAVTALKPDNCANGISVYQDVSYGGRWKCFGPGDYNLANYCMIYDAVYPWQCNHTWENQITSWDNRGESHSGYFYSNNLYCNGVGSWSFGPGDYVANVGAACNDTFWFLHVNN